MTDQQTSAETSLEAATKSGVAPLDRMAFGVGCFHFALRREPPFRFVPAEYEALLRSRLERIGALNNLALRVGDADSYEVDVDGVGGLGRGQLHFPPLSDCEISFDLYIPGRIQDELSRPGVHQSLNTEHFRIFIRYGYHGPVAFVQLIGTADSLTPSGAVRVVREFLSRELPEAEDGIVFEMVGPSPFHADFFVECIPAFDEGSDVLFFERERLHLFGYADLTFRYQVADFAEMRDAAEMLFGELEAELGLFYEIHRYELRSYENWGDIESDLMIVTDDSPPTGIVDRWRRRVSRGNLISRLHKGLAHFEAARLLERHQIEQHHRHTYGRDRPTFLQEFLDDALRDSPVFPTTQISQLISFVEERRSKAVELLVVLLAAVVGGFAGSLLTLASQ